MYKRVITITLIIILGIIIIPTIYKVREKHKENLILVVEKEFSYQALKCSKENKCDNERVYLKELYDQKYLEKELVNPITKKYYDKDSYIDLKTNKIELIS